MTESADYVQFAPALRKFFECIHLRVNTRCGFAVQASRKKPPQFLMASVSATASTASRIIALRDTPLYAVAHIAHWQAALSLLSSAKSPLSVQKYAGKYHTIRRRPAKNHAIRKLSRLQRVVDAEHRTLALLACRYFPRARCRVTGRCRQVVSVRLQMVAVASHKRVRPD